METLSQIGSIAARGPGLLFAANAFAKGTNLIYQVAARGAFNGGGYALKKGSEAKNWASSKVFTPVELTEEEATAAELAATKAKALREERYDTYVKPVVKFGPVATLLKQVQITETPLMDLLKDFGATAIFSVALLEGAAFVFGESPLNVNSALKYITHLRVSNESVVANLIAGAGQVKTWGTETYAAFRA